MVSVLSEPCTPHQWRKLPALTRRKLAIAGLAGTTVMWVSPQRYARMVLSVRTNKWDQGTLSRWPGIDIRTKPCPVARSQVGVHLTVSGFFGGIASPSVRQSIAKPDGQPLGRPDESCPLAPPAHHEVLNYSAALPRHFPIEHLGDHLRLQVMISAVEFGHGKFHGGDLGGFTGYGVARCRALRSAPRSYEQTNTCQYSGRRSTTSRSPSPFRLMYASPLGIIGQFRHGLRRATHPSASVSSEGGQVAPT